MEDKRIRQLVHENADFKNVIPAFDFGCFAGAYLFASEDDVFIDCFVQELVCKAYCKHLTSGGMPCGECEECRKVISRTKIDVSYYGYNGTTIKKEEIKSLIDNVITKPFESKEKFLVIENAENLSEITQNLMLKTLEELPSFTTIIFKAKSLSSILPTIKSRCKTFSLKPLPRHSLLKIMGTSEKAIRMVDMSFGMLGTALEYEKRQALFDSCYAFAEGMLYSFIEISEMPKYINLLTKNKDDIKHYIKITLNLFALAYEGKVSHTSKPEMLAKIVLHCNECLSLIDKKMNLNMIIDKFLMGIITTKTGGFYV